MTMVRRYERPEPEREPRKPILGCTAVERIYGTATRNLVTYQGTSILKPRPPLPKSVTTPKPPELGPLARRATSPKQKATPPPETMAAQIRAAYAFHERKAMLRKAAEDEIRPDEATLSAIGRVRVELEDRTRKRLPVATDRTAIAAAVQIQAFWRGSYARMWTARELAADSRRSTYPVDNKKRVAMRVVYAARKAFLEYGAAVRLQAMWRGYFARTEIQLEIHAVATAAVTRLQALFRRYLVKRSQNWLLEATLTIQAHWRRCMCVRSWR